MSNAEARRIVVAVTGSVAAYKAATLFSLLVKSGYQVRCIMSENAHRFVGPSSLGALSGNEVHTSMFSREEAIPHIEMAAWADMVLVYPASAAAIARLRMGAAEDLLGALYLACDENKPFLIAPAMNSQMFAHSAVKENLEVLGARGVRILPTGKGLMACGTIGYGRLLEPEETFRLLQEL